MKISERLAMISRGERPPLRVPGGKLGAAVLEEALALIEDAKMLEEAGAVALLREAVPLEVASVITESTELPVIGICSGSHCDGQVLVMHDMLGFGVGHPPRSVKQYAQLHGVLVEAFRAYAKDVTEGSFPAAQNSVAMDPAELAELQRALRSRGT